MGKSKLYHILSELNSLRWSLVYKGLPVGLASGLLAALYRTGVELGVGAAEKVYGFLRQRPAFIPLWLLCAAAAGYIVYLLIKAEPLAKGSGIPQVEGIVLFGMKMKWYTILMARYAAGFLTSVFGVSLGREGPSIQIGACGGQALASKLSGSRLEKNYLITAGAAAGLSAAFNAPLSGILFVLEEMHRTFSPYILVAATASALAADMVSKYIFGLTPALFFAPVPQLPLQYYIWLIPAGILSGLAGAAANKGLLYAGAFYNKLPPPARPIAALAAALPCGLLLPQVIGGGANLVGLSQRAQIGIAAAVLMFAVKLVFTCVCFGSGIPGGIFMPILSMGALCGCFFGETLAFFGMPGEYIAVFCVCSMAGVMSASVKAPVTSILLMAEMNGSLVHLLPVAAVAFTALFTSDMLKISPIYEVLLGNIVRENNAELKKNAGGGIGTLIEAAVEPGSEAAGKRVKDIHWPEGSLVVGLRRGSEELVPNGGTEIMPGDYLILLSAERRYGELNSALRALCRLDR